MGWWRITMRVIYFVWNKPSPADAKSPPSNSHLPCSSLTSKSQSHLHCWVCRLWNLQRTSKNYDWLHGEMKVNESLDLQGKKGVKECRHPVLLQCCCLSPSSSPLVCWVTVTKQKSSIPKTSCSSPLVWHVPSSHLTYLLCLVLCSSPPVFLCLP